MKSVKRILLVLLVAMIGLVLYTFITTGFFRSIENRFDGEVIKEIGLKGAEDIVVIAEDSIAIISATDRSEFPPPAQEYGGLYLMELKSGEFVVKHLTANFELPFAPHGISVFKSDSTYTIAVVNHTADYHSIEIFSMKDENLTHLQTLKSTKLTSPNDIVLLDESRFYVTNDHAYEHGFGRFMEDYGNLAVSDFLYYDGQQFEVAADGISFANGINYDEDRNLLFVSSPRRFLVKVYNPNSDGSVEFIEDIPCGTGVDNIEFDEKGDLWIGSHPDLLHFASYAKQKKDISPSEIIKIDYRGKGDYSVESLYENDGSEVSGTSVAAPFGDLIFAGTVKDDKFLILKRN